MNEGVGTLNERTLHAMLKLQYEPNAERHEVKVCGYIADIQNEQGIVEIQTRCFEKLVPKLKAFLEQYDVTVVYPIARTKFLAWIDPKTGEVVSRRKSPKIGTVHDVFCELWKIRACLSHPRFHLHLVFCEIEEYRALDGWGKKGKRGSTRRERIPLALLDTVTVDSIEEYQKLLPDGLPSPFTTTDYAKGAHCTQRSAGRAVYTLWQGGLLERIGKRGRAYLYQQKRP